MKLLLVVCAVFCVAKVNGQCYNKVENAGAEVSRNAIQHVCNAHYGAFQFKNHTDLAGLANLNVKKSFEYLLMATKFGKYNVNRPGFKKLMKKLSDDTWHATIDIVKHAAKRGTKVEVKYSPSPLDTTALNEFNSLGLALDMHKDIAKKTIAVHKNAGRNNEHQHDPDLLSYIENEFAEKHAEVIRDLSGYLTELLPMRKDAVSLLLFDEYLTKM